MEVYPLGPFRGLLDRRLRNLLPTAALSFDELALKALSSTVGRDYRRTDGRCSLPPEWIPLVVHNACNLRCEMCDVGLREKSSFYWRHLIGDAPASMSLEMLESILASAKDFWPRPRIGMAFAEPLLHPDAAEFFRTIKRHGFYCQITTNGTRLPKLAEEIVEAKVDRLTVSLDGPAEIHDEICGKQGVFAKLMEGMEILEAKKAHLRSRRPEVHFSYTINPKNVGCLVEVSELIARFNPASFNISQRNFITDALAAKHNQEHGDDLGGALRVNPSCLGATDPSDIDTQTLSEQLDKLAAPEGRSRRPPFTVVPTRWDVETLDQYYGDHTEIMTGRSCTTPFRMMMVKTDGTVIPSHARCFDLPVGKLGELSLAEIWNGEAFRSFRLALKNNGGHFASCSRCGGLIATPFS